MTTEFKEVQSSTVLGSLAKEYKGKEHSPGVVQQYWDRRLNILGERANIKFVVPMPDLSVDRIKELERKGRELIYVPEEFYQERGLDLLVQIHPESTNNYQREIFDISHVEGVVGGWKHIEAGWQTPNTDQSVGDFEKFYRARGLNGIDYVTYVLGTEECLDRTGSGFDQTFAESDDKGRIVRMVETWSLILGSRDKGKLIDANTTQSGLVELSGVPHQELPRGDRGGRTWGLVKSLSKSA